MEKSNDNGQYGNGMHIHAASNGLKSGHLAKALELNAYDLIGDDHLASAMDTPIRPDAFNLSDEEKIQKITVHFQEIMTILGLDLSDDSLKGTPHRVAKMYVNEIFSGLNPANKPAITLFDNKYQYDEMLVEKNITVHSHCEHHFVPIMGKAHLAYIPNKKVIGLSKLNRIVQYYAKRPQVQERLTVQIANELKKVLQTEDVAVLIEADHACVMTRGIKDVHSSTVSAKYHGKFDERAVRLEFLRYLNMQ